MRALRAGAVVVGAAVLSVLLGGLAAVSLAFITTSPIAFLTGGGLVSAGVWALMVWRYGGKAGRPRRGLLAATGSLVAAGILVSVLLPLNDARLAPTRPPGAGMWTLPDGTHLAFGVIHARPATAPPVVALHGGPGVPDLAGELSGLRGLAADGHDVYAYAQLGAGRSSRLADPSGYTVPRAVADLEQVRRRIGARRLILVGHSYGAYLAAAYLAAHPQRVARIVFVSPGSLRDGLTGAELQARLSWPQRLQVYSLLVRPRLLLTYALTQVNPAAAHAFAPDGELDPRMARVYAATERALHCPGHSGPVLHGAAFYANQVPQTWHRPPVPDIAPRLRTLHVPALVLKGQCDYVDWHTAAEYIKAIPGARLAYLRRAGHDIRTDRPAAYQATIRAFLARRPIPHLLAAPTRGPADYQPNL